MPRSIVLSTHLYFAREGATIDGITVGRESKPDADPISNWTNIGIVGDYDVNNERNEIAIKRPMPGQMVDYDTIRTNQRQVHTVQVREGSPLMWELLYGTAAAIGVGGGFVQNGMTKFLKGWFKFQQYDQNNQLVNVMDQWGSADIEGQTQFAMAQTEVITFSLRILALYSSLNGGNLSNLS